MTGVKNYQMKHWKVIGVGIREVGVGQILEAVMNLIHHGCKT